MSSLCHPTVRKELAVSTTPAPNFQSQDTPRLNEEVSEPGNDHSRLLAQTCDCMHNSVNILELLTRITSLDKNMLTSLAPANVKNFLSTEWIGVYLKASPENISHIKCCYDVATNRSLIDAGVANKVGSNKIR